MMLHTICMFATYQNYTDLNETMDGRISYFKKVSKAMLDVVGDGTFDIKQNFFSSAKLEIEDFSKLHSNYFHVLFAELLRLQLEKKVLLQILGCYKLRWNISLWKPLW